MRSAISAVAAIASGTSAKQRRHLGRPLQHVLAVAAALRLAGVERGVHADRDQRVLQRPAAPAVDVHVVGRHDRQPEPPGERAPGAHARLVAALELALQLDPEPSVEGLGELSHRRLVLDPVPRAAGQAEQPVGQLQHVSELGHRLVGRPIGAVARAGVGAGDQLAEVLVAAPALDQQRQVAVLAATRTVSSQPVIGFSPAAAAACANTSAPQRLSWSVSASAR